MKQQKVKQMFEEINLIPMQSLPDSEIVKRKALIHFLTSDNGLFKLKAIQKAMSPMMLLVYMKSVTDEMLSDYVIGMISFYEYLKHKNQDDLIESQRLTEPSLNILKELLSSESWIDYVIEREEIGEKQFVDGMEIPFNSKALRQHMSRMPITFAVPGITVPEIKTSFYKYNKELYLGETVKEIKTIPQESIGEPIKPFDIKVLVEKIKHKYKETFEMAMYEVNSSRVNPQNAKKKEFTTVASILFRNEWIVSKTSFTDWLSAFSMAYNRPVPSYKESQVMKSIESLIRKAPFLEKPPFKKL